MQIDPVASLRTWIIANCPAVVALIGGAGNERIFSPGVPRDEARAWPRAAITFYQYGGSADISLWISEIIFSFHCYGSTDREANEVFRALDNCLNRQTCLIVGTIAGARTLAFTVFRATGPESMVEPLMEWPFVRCTYRIRFWEDLT